MKTKKIYSSILLMTLCTICIAQEGETITKKEQKNTQEIKSSKLITPPFSIQIANNKNLKEAKEIKAKATREFPSITAHIKPNNQKYNVILGDFKTLEEAQKKIALIKNKHPESVLISNQKN
ncbi:SPOR domain-containing protein [Cellulophaga fucicola]|uniref:Sporulation related domain-containing protein n=1 Tax=Cellulophaga fucicola TaxID=76595 RepID=A0A1K1PFP2_9FLAO|nr:SPOR domain-containing protein [Cellulophaga fucicola]SFW46277.1 Sporulation related domain-containing protein [Cellulophaga fucicola]